MSPTHHYYTEHLTVNGPATPLWTGSCHLRAFIPCCHCGWRGHKFDDDDTGRWAALQQWQCEHLASSEGTDNS
jgi:hypothetical protein